MTKSNTTPAATAATFTPDATYAIENRAGNIVDVSTDAMTANTLAFIFDYGMRQYINDAGAGALAEAYTESTGLSGKDVDEAERKAWGKDNPDAVNDMRETGRVERAASIAANQHGAPRTAGRTADPLATYRAAIVLAAIKNNPAASWAREHNAIPAKDQAARKAYRITWATEHAAEVDPLAQSMHEKALDTAATISELSFPL